jgi:hypothetical protein
MKKAEVGIMKLLAVIMLLLSFHLQTLHANCITACNASSDCTNETMTMQELQKCESMKVNCKVGCQRGALEDRRDETEGFAKTYTTMVIVGVVLIIALPLCIGGVVGCCRLMMMIKRRGPPPPGGWNNRGGAPGQNLNPVVPVGYAGFNPNPNFYNNQPQQAAAAAAPTSVSGAKSDGGPSNDSGLPAGNSPA